MSTSNPSDASRRSPLRGGPPDLHPARWKIWVSGVLGVAGIIVVIIAVVFFVPQKKTLDEARAQSLAELDEVSALAGSGDVADETSLVACGEGLQRLQTMRTIIGTFDAETLRSEYEAFAASRDWVVRGGGSSLTIASAALLEYELEFGSASVRISTASLCAGG